MNNFVLCAVDVSDIDSDADVLKTAAHLAEMDGAQLDVITVLPDFGMSLVGGFFKEGHQDKMVKIAKSHLDAFTEAHLTPEQNAKVRHVVTIGKTYEEVLKAAKKTNADLIVVGAHKADIKDYLLGPNAARIVRHSKCSVFVVR
ncbi:universal stress protein [Falsihalocynthiibacter sp. SS001]|uniref:universal stress protein n=1 Tax=Falsihalocynthiibacter sp. SS001 TaxID=3349698 RepID=UPI0036D28397